jgi:hypothetical protein
MEEQELELEQYVFCQWIFQQLARGSKFAGNILMANIPLLSMTYLGVSEVEQTKGKYNDLIFYS